MITKESYEKATGKPIRYEIPVKFEMAKELIKKKGTLEILDLACGHGLFANLLEKDWHYTGVDIDDDRLRRCMMIYDGEFLKADANTFYMDKKFDVILALDVIEHLHSPKNCLRNLTRMLKEDGILIVSNPNQYGVWGILWEHDSILTPLISPIAQFVNSKRKENTEKAYYEKGCGKHLFHWNVSEFKELAKPLRLVKVVNRPCFLDGVGFLFKDSRRLLKVDKLLGRIWPTGWLLMFRK